MTLMQIESQQFWVRFAAFGVPETVLVSFLLPAALQASVDRAATVPLLLPGGLAGFFLACAWFMDSQRQLAYYIARQAQVNHLEPSGWGLNEVISEFGEGKPVNIGASKYQMPWIARTMRSRYPVFTQRSQTVIAPLRRRPRRASSTRGYDVVAH